MALWDIALEQARSKENSSGSSQQSQLLIVGAKSSGKTTIVNRFLDKEESPKPTVALEYTFGRKSKGHATKDIVHVWELGGGLAATQLLDTTLDEDNILRTAVVIVVDLSSPATIWATVEGLTTALLQCVSRVIANAPKEKKLKEQLRQKQKDRLQAVEADDAQIISPFPLPLTIVGGKFDQFQEKVDHERKKVVAATLRFLAHQHNAGLYFFSVQRHEQAVAKLRAHLTQLAFGQQTAEGQEYLAELGRPFVISAGRDSFAKIGLAPVEDGDYNKLSAKTPMDLWKYAFINFFPEERHTRQLSERPADPTQDASDPHRFDEAAVDKARAAKDEELEKYKRISDRKMRDLMQQAVNEGISVSLPRHSS